MLETISNAKTAAFICRRGNLKHHVKTWCVTAASASTLHLFLCFALSEDFGAVLLLMPSACATVNFCSGLAESSVASRNANNILPYLSDLTRFIDARMTALISPSTFRQTQNALTCSWSVVFYCDD